MVEDLVDLFRSANRHIDRVAVPDRVEGKGIVEGFRAKLTPGFPFWVKVINGKPANPGGEPFIQPKLQLSATSVTR
jgi:hypothetical protein